MELSRFAARLLAVEFRNTESLAITMFRIEVYLNNLPILRRVKANFLAKHGTIVSASLSINEGETDCWRACGVFSVSCGTF